MDRQVITQSLHSQYIAALKTLKKVIDDSPDAFLYADREAGVPPWQVAVHTYWYGELYLAENWPAFEPIKAHRAENQWWNPIPWEKNRKPVWADPATRAELKEMDKHIRAILPKKLAEFPLDGNSGFNWIPHSRLETHVYNIRHLQHHAAQLICRLRQHSECDIRWVLNGGAAAKKTSKTKRRKK